MRTVAFFPALVSEPKYGTACNLTASSSYRGPSTRRIRRFEEKWFTFCVPCRRKPCDKNDGVVAADFSQVCSLPNCEYRMNFCTAQSDEEKNSQGKAQVSRHMFIQMSTFVSVFPPQQWVSHPVPSPDVPGDGHPVPVAGHLVPAEIPGC